MTPAFQPIPGARRVWARPDGLAVIDELDDEVHALVLRIWRGDFRPPTAIEFHLDEGEAARFRRDPASAGELADDVFKRSGYYQGRRPQTSAPRALVRQVWQSADRKDRLDQDDQGDLWMDAAVATGITKWRVQFRLHPGEASACVADPEQARELAERVKASPRPYWLRPPERWEPGKKRRIWQDPILQWMLEEDDAGALWLEVVVYQGFVVSLAEVNLRPDDAVRCRKSWEASGALAERIARAKGRYP